MQPDADPRPTPEPTPEPEARPISGAGEPVDHDRQPGVPPPSADDDYEDPVDIAGAESFPASDPPASW